MRGTMLWFNPNKDLGEITTDEGERLDVVGAAFADGVRPQPRCAGTVVEFSLMRREGTTTAVDVAFVPVVAPRRARRRSSAWRG